MTNLATARSFVHRGLASGSLSTALELLGVVLIGIGLHAIYPPLALLFLGVSAFGSSFAVEAARRRAMVADAHTPARRSDDARCESQGEGTCQSLR